MLALLGTSPWSCAATKARPWRPSCAATWTRTRRQGAPGQPEDYVDVAHIMELHSTQGGVCAHCAAWLPPRCKPADPEQATVDRLDNALAHVKGSLPALQPHAPLERESFVFFTYSLGL